MICSRKLYKNYYGIKNFLLDNKLAKVLFYKTILYLPSQQEKFFTLIHQHHKDTEKNKDLNALLVSKSSTRSPLCRPN